MDASMAYELLALVGSNVLGNDVGQTLRSLDGRLDGLTIGRLVGQI